jgi:hypothetical protein
MPPVPEDVDAGLAAIRIAQVLGCSALDVARPDFPLVWRRNALIRLEVDRRREEAAERARQQRRARRRS